MFHQNAQHTGLSSFPGPTVPFLKWKLQTSGPVDSSPAIGFGRVYVGSEDGSLYALNLQGNLLWKFQTSSPIRTSSAIGSDGTIYLASYIKSASGEHEGILYAINPGGNLKWNFTLANFQGDDSLSSPIIGPDGTIYASDEGGGVVAVHPDGTLKWEVAASGEVFGPPALGPDGTVYVGVDDPDPSGACGQCLLAINPDGTVKWGVLHIGTFFSPAVGSDGTVYIQGFAINPNGTVKWENGAFSSPSIGFDGTIYGTMDDLDATNPDGTLRWVFPVRGSASCTPAGCSYVYVQPSSVAIGSNGILYFGVGITHFCNCAPVPSGSQNASLYAVSSNETLVWKFPIGTTNACTSECPFFALSDPAIGSNGTVYVGSTDGNLYAVG
jgi:outer membrane protein assembly factor BamB